MATISTLIKINDGFSGALDKLSSKLQSAQNGFNKMKSALNGGSSFSSAAKQSDGLFKSMVGGNVVGNMISNAMGMATNGIHSMIGELNEAQTSWTTFEGNMRQIGKSPAEIAKAKNELQRFAEQTIYGAADMSSTYSQLAAVGTKNTTQLVKGFGGLAAAAANPAQAMKTLSQQATQMAAKPKVQWEDFKLMVEQTPAGMAAVAKTMGMSLTELISKIQDGKIKTQDFLDAVAKTGTNANFSKMATQYKTIGDAVQGLKEQITNGLLKAWGKLSEVGISAVNELSDALGRVNFDALGDGLLKAINYIRPIFDDLKAGFENFFKSFSDTGVGDSIINMFMEIANAVKDLMNAFNQGDVGKSIFEQLGKLSGNSLKAVADAISTIAKIAGQLDPSSIKELGIAFVILKGGVKGLMLAGLVKALQAMNDLDPETLKKIAEALKVVAIGVMAFKGLSSVIGILKGLAMAIGGLIVAGAAIQTIFGNFKSLGGIKGIFDAFKGGKFKGLKEYWKNLKKMNSAKGMKTKTPEMPDTGKPGKILSNAGAYLKLGAAFALVGAGALMVGAGFKLLADTATQMSSAGVGAIATFFGMIAAIAALVLLVRFLGPSLISGAVGFAIFAAALLLIGVAVLAASAGIALLATQLPAISEYGASAAVGLLALAGAITVFGLAAIVGAVGVLLLGVALVVLAVGLVAAGVGALIFAVGLALVGITALIAAVGVLLLGVAIALIAVMVIIAAVGMLLFGVALVLVAAMAMVAAVGLMMMSVALMMIMVTAMVSAVGLMLLAVALMLVGPMAMIAAVGLMLLAAAAIMLGAGLMVVAASAMAVAAALVAVGASVMVMASLFIAAGSMMVSAITSAMSGVVSAVRSGISSAVSAARSFGSALVSVGRQLIQGLVNGITSMVGAAVSAVQGVASKVVSAAKSVLHIGSPSRLFRQYGRWVDQGLIIGLNRDAGAAADASASMAQGVVDAASGMSPTLDPIGLSGINPGDLLAAGFDRALDAISNVAGAITGLDGSRANIGIFGQGAVSSSSVGSDTVTSGTIAPSSVLTNNNSNSQTDNSTQVQIDKGAIVINSTGDPADDVDKLLEELDKRIVENRNKALGGG
ncbi:tape measure protein [Lactobacillus paragasseri]|uniref:tape measure protein n=1 Tax=Lactobacillus paragasseri TaxID=2107999 RepID=UPI00217D469D|nr:tape measure protein [Lactobacillus paragasseri]UWI43325.1 tape measure protein [Lactobacillus paragasseri]UWI44568.1 tape measure protein [Lactobacillus paragasseri]